MAGPVDHSDLIQKKLIEEELVLITDMPHPSMSSIKDIRTRTLLVFRSGCSYRAKLRQWLHQEGITPNKIMEFGTLEAILGCVSAGLGVSMLPHAVVEKYVQDGSLKQHPIPNPFGKVDTVFIYRKDTFMSTSLVRFMDMFGS